MISWVVATHRKDILDHNLLPTLAIGDGDELILVEDAASITAAYAQGQERAQQPIRCYVHSDVQILDLGALRSALIEESQGVGIVGVVGSRSPIMPWWNGSLLGSVQDSRLGTLNFGQGGPCAILDGLLLASRRRIEWDQDWPGWHGYDYDSCKQMLELGYLNICISQGHTMVRHNSDSPLSTHTIEGWEDAVIRFHHKWG